MGQITINEVAPVTDPVARIVTAGCFNSIHQ